MSPKRRLVLLTALGFAAGCDSSVSAPDSASIYMARLICVPQPLRTSSDTEDTFISRATGINDSAVVSGTWYISRSTPGEVYTSEAHRFIYSEDGFVELDAPAQFGGTRRINDLGQILLNAGSTNGETSGPSIYESGSITALNEIVPAESGWRLRSGTDLNNRNQIVGIGLLNGEDRGFLLDLAEEPTIIDLGTLNGDILIPVAINDRGQIVGSTGSRRWPSQVAFLWEDGIATELEGLGGASGANDINESGQIVGYAYSTYYEEPVLWDMEEMIVLDRLPGDTYGWANAINEQGQIVGGSGVFGGQHEPTYTRAVRWLGGKLVDLNTLIQDEAGLELEDAEDINNLGQIVGSAGAGRDLCGYIITPDPDVSGAVEQPK